METGTTGRSHRSVVCAIVGCLFGLAACQTSDAHPSSLDRGIGIPRGHVGFAGGMVATSEAEPAEVAARILERGGNAIDAAAVALFMLNIVEPQSSGIGGGGFMMIYLAGPKQTVVVDSRETAPAGATPRMFLDATGQPVPMTLASTSGYAVGVPGTLRGIEAALGRWGTISLADALAPAIEAAENGIVVNPRLAEAAEDARLRSECDDPDNSPYEAARAVFRPGGEPARCGDPLVAGSLLIQPDLARTLRLIATGGTRAFYDCDHPAGIARAIVAAQRATRASNPNGAGRMTCDDLSSYRPAFREPVMGDYRGYVVRSAPPPSSGGLALVQMLKMLERFPMGDSAQGFGFGAFSTLNVMQEAMRLAFADRAVWMGDTDVVRDLPIGLTDGDYLKARADSCPSGDPSHQFYCIAVGARLVEVRAGDPRRFEHGVIATPPRRAHVSLEQDEGAHTTHITIVDGQGNIVSYTTTIESPWGTGLMVPGFGFMLNNEMTDFNLTPQRRGEPSDADFDPGANDVAPFKRPRSSMAPTILFVHGEEGERPVAAFGSPGGSTIINTMLNFTVDLIDHRLRVQEAVECPRISLTKAADDATTSVEAGFDAEVLDRLRAIGYRFSREAAVIGAVQAVVIDPRTGMIYGDADPRRNGAVVGLPRRPVGGTP